MGARRLVVAGLLAMGLVLGLAACMGHWFTPKQAATLIVGDAIPSGGLWQVLICVANMPDKGLSGIQFGTVGNEALTFTNVDITTVVATGENGFTVTAQNYVVGPPAKGALIAVNPPTGVVGGSIVKLTFQATAANPTVTVDATKVTLLSHLNTWITAWNLSTGKVFYAKRGDRAR
jgi:hypothetical protein